MKSVAKSLLVSYMCSLKGGKPVLTVVVVAVVAAAAAAAAAAVAAAAAAPAAVVVVTGPDRAAENASLWSHACA